MTRTGSYVFRPNPTKIQPGPTQDPPSPALIHPSKQKLTLASLPFCPKPFAAQAPPQPPRAAISPLGHYPSCRAAGRRLSLSLGPLFLAHTRRGSHSLPRRPSQSLSFPRQLASLPRRPHCCCFCPHSPSHCPPSPSLCCCFCPPSASAVAASATVPPPPLQLLLPPRPRSASGCCWFFWFRVRLLLVLLEFWSGPAAASSRFKEIQAMDFGGIGDEEEEEFEFSRNYFLAKELGSSAKKSTHKLTDIDVVDEQELREASLHILPKHENEIALLMDSYKTMYPEWVLALRSGFGLLMYGFGSKKALIEDFASTALTEYSVVVINGYLQAINLKQVLIALVEVLYDQLKTKRRASSRDLPKNTQSMEDLLTFLDEAEIEETDFFVCVVINNLDGPGLRDFETQQYLARLAACSHIRIVASIDHVNAPLYWDKNMAHTQFNWCWYHVPTFAPYKVEGMFYPLILAHGGANQNVKTATIVLQSLTPNAQSVFKVLAEHQLSHPEEGMPISDLYSVCRERFLVSSQVTLNSHLTEFKDHELVKIKKNSDGQECLFIPLSAEALQKVLQEIS